MDQSRAQVMEELALYAWNRYKTGDADALGDVYEVIFPFCMQVASRVCGRYLDSGSDESSISRMALWEAFEKYQPERGSLIPFIGQVVRTRLIDYRRREKRNHIVLSLSGPDNYQVAMDEKICEDIIDELARQQEIEKLRALLLTYNISFNDLVKQSPKQEKTRREANRIASIIASDGELVRYVQERKSLPVKDLRKRFGISEKIMERHRKYIIAHILVLMHDFTMVRGYINEGRGM